MPQNITDVVTYTSPVTCPIDGEPATAASAKLASQALANRTAYLKDRADDTDAAVAILDAYDGSLYTSLATFFVAVATLYNVARNCCSFNFSDAANGTLVPGDYLVFTKDTGFSGAIAGEPTVDFLNGTGTDDDIVTAGGDDATIYQFDFRLEFTSADVTDGLGFFVELYVGGVLLRTFKELRTDGDATEVVHVQATTLFKAAPGSAVKLRYSTTNGANASCYSTGSHASMRAIYQLPLTSSYLPVMPAAP